MPLNTPDSVNEVIDRVINDVFLALNKFGAKPSLKNSWLNSMIVAFSNRVFDFYFALNQSALEALPDTAVDNLDRWGAIYKVTPTPGSVSSGLVAVTGVVGSPIPDKSVLSTGDGFEYASTGGDLNITSKSPSVLLLTRDGTVATAVTTDVHDLSDNVLVTITGAVETDYNVIDSAITVISATSFTFTVSGSPTTPATGTIVANFDTATLPIESSDFSEDANTAGLAGFTFEESLVGVDEIAGATFPGILGGLSQETRDEFQTRLLERIQNPVAHFNSSDIIFTARAVSGVTRVFIFEITPTIGQVTVYFMRDNDETGAIADGVEIQKVKDALDKIRPANTAPEDLIVLAPTPVPTDFSFVSLVPNTSSMKSAITENLTQFFKEGTSVGENVTSDAYRSVIFNTIDTTNGARVEEFVLNNPSGDILVNDGEIATLGNVS